MTPPEAVNGKRRAAARAQTSFKPTPPLGSRRLLRGNGGAAGFVGAFRMTKTLKEAWVPGWVRPRPVRDLCGSAGLRVPMVMESPIPPVPSEYRLFGPDGAREAKGGGFWREGFMGPVWGVGSAGN